MEDKCIKCEYYFHIEYSDEYVNVETRKCLKSNIIFHDDYVVTKCNSRKVKEHE